MSYTTENTKDSPIKNTKMSHTSKTKLDYTPTPTKVYKITDYDIYDYDNAYGQHNTTMLRRCNPDDDDYEMDIRKEILEYLLPQMEDDLLHQLDYPEDGIRSETDYKLMEEELNENGYFNIYYLCEEDFTLHNITKERYYELMANPLYEHESVLDMDADDGTDLMRREHTVQRKDLDEDELNLIPS